MENSLVSNARFHPQPNKKLEVGNTLAYAFPSAWESLSDLLHCVSPLPGLAPSHLCHMSMPPCPPN